MSLGEQAGRYRILGLLATGGMGEVYRAELATEGGAGKTVALKVIRKDLASDPDLARLFVEEAKVAMSLSHANVVHAFDVGRLDERLFIALEHVDGGDLATLLRACRDVLGQPLPQRHALLVTTEALKGLDYAHRRKDAKGDPLRIVHRDISPGNILVSYEGEVKVADFGIAQSAAKAQTIAGTIKGKIPYMAPEQVRGASVDARADLYAMGAVLYEMLTGRRVFLGDGRAIIPDVVTGRFAKPRAITTEIPEELERIVLRALATEPDARFPSAAAMRQELEAFAMKSGWLLSTTDLADLLGKVLPHGETRESMMPTLTPPKRAKQSSAELVAQPLVPGDDAFDVLLGAELARVDSSEPFSVLTKTGTAHRAVKAPPGTQPLVPVALETPRPGELRALRDVAPPTTTTAARRGSVALVAVVALLAIAAVAIAYVVTRGSSAQSERVDADAISGGAADARVNPGNVADSGAYTNADGGSGAAAPTDARANAPTDARANAVTDAAASAIPALDASRAPPHHSHGPLGPTPPDAPPAAATGTLSVNTDPWSYVELDAHRLHATPLVAYALPSGAHTLTLTNPEAHLSRTLEITIAPGEHRRISLDLAAPPP